MSMNSPITYFLETDSIEAIQEWEEFCRKSLEKKGKHPLPYPLSFSIYVWGGSGFSKSMTEKSLDFFNFEYFKLTTGIDEATMPKEAIKFPNLDLLIDAILNDRSRFIIILKASNIILNKHPSNIMQKLIHSQGGNSGLLFSCSSTDNFEKTEEENTIVTQKLGGKIPNLNVIAGNKKLIISTLSGIRNFMHDDCDDEQYEDKPSNNTLSEIEKNMKFREYFFHNFGTNFRIDSNCILSEPFNDGSSTEIPLITNKQEKRKKKKEENESTIKNYIYLKHKWFGKDSEKKKVVVIGNGPSGLKKEIGAIINSADTVIRINAYQTAGFESYVGSKTDIWIMNSVVGPNRKAINIEARRGIKPRLIILRGLFSKRRRRRFKKIREAISKCFPSAKITSISRKSLRKLKRNIRCKKTPSTGSHVLSYALKRFSGPIYIYGFDMIKGGSVTSHYYNTGCALKRCHDPKKEGNYFRKLVAKNKLIFLDDDVEKFYQKFSQKEGVDKVNGEMEEEIASIQKIEKINSTVIKPSYENPDTGSVMYEIDGSIIPKIVQVVINDSNLIKLR